jgi:hypothetical protein
MDYPTEIGTRGNHNNDLSIMIGGVNIFNSEGIDDFLKWKDTDKERGKV